MRAAHKAIGEDNDPGERRGRKSGGADGEEQLGLSLPPDRGSLPNRSSRIRRRPQDAL